MGGKKASSAPEKLISPPLPMPGGGLKSDFTQGRGHNPGIERAINWNLALGVRQSHATRSAAFIPPQAGMKALTLTHEGWEFGFAKFPFTGFSA